MGEFVVEVGSACSKVRFLWSCDGGVFVPQGVIFQKNWKACSAVSKRRQLLGEYIDVHWFMLICIHSFDLCWFMLIHLIYVDSCWFILMYRSCWGMRKTDSDYTSNPLPLFQPSQPRSEFEGEILFSHKNKGTYILRPPWGTNISHQQRQLEGWCSELLPVTSDECCRQPLEGMKRPNPGEPVEYIIQNTEKWRDAVN